jgi:hypothetical protein
MDRDDLSKEEFETRQRLIEICNSIADQYSDLIYEEFKE